MMKIKSVGAASLLAVTLLLISGCDQAEKSARDLLGKTAESAKQAIDDTHKAAEQALSDATGKAETEEKTSDDDAKKSSHSI